MRGRARAAEPRTGQIVKTITLDDVAMKLEHIHSLKVAFNRSLYRWHVYAIDLAGAALDQAAVALFRVRCIGRLAPPILMVGCGISSQAAESAL